MSQLILFVAVQLLGSWGWLAIGPRDAPRFATALGFLLGLAFAVFMGVALLLLGVFTAGWVGGVLGLTTVIAIALAAYRRRVTPRAVAWLLVGAAGFAALCVPFCVWDLSVLTYDSHRFIALAGEFRDQERLSLGDLSHLHAWSTFEVVAHSLAVITSERHLYALAPAFSISLFATLAAVLDRGLHELGVGARRRTFAISLAIGLLLAVPLVRLHVVYIHANWTAAGYLFAFAALWWLADVRRDPSYLPGAFLSLLAFSFARVESPMFTAMVLVLMLSTTQLARSAILIPYVLFTLVLTAWLVTLATVVPADSLYLTPARTLLMAGVVFGVFVVFLARETSLGRRLAPKIPPLVAVLAVVGIAIVAVLRSETFLISFPRWQRDLWRGRFWGLFLWPTCAVLAVLALRWRPPRSLRPVGYAIALFFALVTFLAALGDAYGPGRYGSLTRITLHVVPLIAFYFALVFTPARSRSDLRESPERTEEVRLNPGE